MSDKEGNYHHLGAIPLWNDFPHAKLKQAKLVQITSLASYREVGNWLLVSINLDVLYMDCFLFNM